MVRPTQGQVIRYVAGQVPDNKDDLPRFLKAELLAIQSALSVIQDGQIDVTTVAPTKPRDGMIRRADGTGWSPSGLGAGVYCYFSGNWNKLG